MKNEKELTGQENVETLNEILINLIKETPNDMDLGKKVRSHFINESIYSKEK